MIVVFQFILNFDLEGHLQNIKIVSFPHRLAPLQIKAVFGRKLCERVFTMYLANLKKMRLWNQDSGYHGNSLQILVLDSIRFGSKSNLKNLEEISKFFQINFQPK